MFIKSIKFIFISLFSLFVMLILATLLLFSTKPLVAYVKPLTPVMAKQAKALAKRYHQQLTQPSITQLSIAKQEAETLCSAANRTYPQLACGLKVSENQAQFMLTLKPIQHIDIYLNFSLAVMPSNQGVHWGALQLGSYDIPAKYVINWLDEFLAWQFSQPMLREMVSSIRYIKLIKHTIVIGFHRMDFNDSSNGLTEKLAKLRDKLSLFGDKKLIIQYRQLLVKYAKNNQNESLAYWLKLVLKQAFVNSQLDDEYNAQAHNRAALTALVLYFGSDKFEQLVGEFDAYSASDQQRRQYLQANVSLNNRNDLQKHFIYSMALTLFSDAPTSMTLGELKELLDTNLGGSGFSFIDLTADKAGNQLAKLAIATKLSAEKLQAYFALTPVTKIRLLPDLSQLVEGLNETDFEQLYGNINSPTFKQVEYLIDQRLAKLEWATN